MWSIPESNCVANTRPESDPEPNCRTRVVYSHHELHGLADTRLLVLRIVEYGKQISTLVIASVHIPRNTLTGPGGNVNRRSGHAELATSVTIVDYSSRIRLESAATPRPSVRRHTRDESVVRFIRVFDGPHLLRLSAAW